MILKEDFVIVENRTYEKYVFIIDLMLVEHESLLDEKNMLLD